MSDDIFFFFFSEEVAIADHKELMFSNVNPLFQTANVGFYATAIISFVHLAKVDYVLACS